MSMESKSNISEDLCKGLKLPPVVICKELHSLIGTVKEMKLITTYEDVLEGLKKYIWERKLCDPYDPLKVCCKDDELSVVLGVAEFTLCDLKTFLKKLVFPVSIVNRDSAEATCSVSDNPLKRKLSDDFETDEKKICAFDVPIESLSPMILHIPPSPSNYDDLSDSVDSIQGYETAYVKDTSDDLRSLEDCGERILAIEETYNLEYEIETDLSDYTFYSGSSDSESEVDIVSEVALDAAILTFVCKTDSDIEFFADDSSDEDVEIPESDHWECNRCNSFNRPPMRYCLKCWEERQEWLPDKKKQTEHKSPLPKKKRKQKKSSSAGNDKDTNEKQKASISKRIQDSQEGSSSEVSSELQVVSPEPSSSACSTSSCESIAKLCIICCSKPASASIIHGKYAHQISCYKCARKLQKQKKRCPVCRRTIDRVVHQITNI